MEHTSIIKILGAVVLYRCIITFVFCTSVDVNEVRVKKGRDMKNFMKDTVDPCNDFYGFACGNWFKYHSLKHKTSGLDVIDVLSDKVNDFILDAIISGYRIPSHRPSANILASNATQMIKKYYLVCRRQKTSKLGPYLDALGVPGGWPVTNATWSENEFDWVNVTAQLKVLNEPALFDLYVAPSLSNMTYTAIHLSAAEFPIFPAKAYLENRDSKIEQILTALIRDPFAELGVNQSDVNRISESIIEFETKLAKIYLKDEDDVDESELIATMTLDSIHEVMPEIDLPRYLKIVSGTTFPGSQEIILISPSYFKDLIGLLNQTASDVLANYFLYRISYAVGGDSDKIGGDCTKELVNAFGSFFGHLYNFVFRDENVEKDVEQIAKNIRESFKKTVSTTKWLDDQTIEESISKLDKLSFRIGGAGSSGAYYKSMEGIAAIQFNGENYHENFFTLQAYNARKLFQNVNRLNVKNDPNFNSAEVNAFYDITVNQVIIPTNILQNLVYDYNFPRSIKYGALGSIIGHETTHSLDDTGRIFDSNGQHREWWSNSSLDEYDDRAECLKDQYAKFTTSVMNITISHIKADTLDENIADNGGLRHAFYAYKDWLELNPAEDETLPGVNMTNMQTFFLSFAQFYCEITRPADALFNSLTDEHSMHDHRVMGTLSNFEEFSEAFQCPKGARMNPTKKCRVW